MKRSKTEDGRVKAEDATEEADIGLRLETMEEFWAASHDRCSDRLAITAFKWVQHSHLVYKGTSVIIVDP